jgi:hypothetical protein
MLVMPIAPLQAKLSRQNLGSINSQTAHDNRMIKHQRRSPPIMTSHLDGPIHRPHK